MILFFYVANIT